MKKYITMTTSLPASSVVKGSKCEHETIRLSPLFSDLRLKEQSDDTFTVSICVTVAAKCLRKFNMLQHESTHTNTRFSCTKCTASFKQRSSLNRHTASKHATEDSKKT
ncbi:unnamed protein product [Leptidea sinapis]|uniref:C2H2-type domain-containing protein n=1 Tax=Leptidea sinapis TaxID=189913 RepID=A0A5E4R501_9NEOP|nr:unnamed protein product [Leptidea sinapis]